MGTAKRERQKANRALREHEQARADARARGVRIAVIVGGAVLLLVALVFLASNVLGDDDEATTEPVATDVPATEAVDVTEPAGTEPSVTEPADPDSAVGRIFDIDLSIATPSLPATEEGSTGLVPVNSTNLQPSSVTC